MSVLVSSPPWTRPDVRPHPRLWSALALGAALMAAAVVAVTGAALVAAAHDVWTATLRTPAWMPAGWLLTAGWFTAHLTAAFAGWRIVVRAPGTPAVTLWAVSLGAELAWMVVFFGLWLPWVAVGAGALVAIVLVATAVAAGRQSRGAAALLTVDMAWIGLLLALNVAVAALN
jgi:tryptophan-rich sensory protein